MQILHNVQWFIKIVQLDWCAQSNVKCSSALRTGKKSSYGRMDEDTIQKINLIDFLSEKYIDVPEIPEGCISCWTKDQITAYYESGGACTPSHPNGLTSCIDLRGPQTSETYTNKYKL